MVKVHRLASFENSGNISLFIFPIMYCWWVYDFSLPFDEIKEIFNLFKKNSRFCLLRSTYFILHFLVDLHRTISSIFLVMPSKT